MGSECWKRTTSKACSFLVSSPSLSSDQLRLTVIHPARESKSAVYAAAVPRPNVCLRFAGKLSAMATAVRPMAKEPACSQV